MFVYDSSCCLYNGRSEQGLSDYFYDLDTSCTDLGKHFVILTTLFEMSCAALHSLFLLGFPFGREKSVKEKKLEKVCNCVGMVLKAI